jgi:DNA helicase-2/ATP-dependent DNA helicase PcrA
MTPLLDELNPAQRDAATIVDGPLLVLAGAGSGKTRVLTYRIAHLVLDMGVEPDHILAITFTNKAATEMRERLELLVGPAVSRMWAMTFHAMCVRMLRTGADRLGFTRSFTIYDDDDKKKMLGAVAMDLGLDSTRYPVGLFASRISAAKNELLDPADIGEATPGPLGPLVVDVFARYQARLQRANAMDFDDLLVNAHRLLVDHPEVLRGYQDRFRYIHVDEYQDTNHVQYRIAALLAQTHANLMVVGDDDQSIYGWRGADIRNILEFEDDFPAARIVRLEQNYRSTQKILEVANYVVAHNSSRKPKTLWTANVEGEAITRYSASDERDEVAFIVAEIERLLRDEDRSYADVAVFYRTHAQSRVIEDVFLRTGTPYKIIGGTQFFARAEIKDVLAYLRVVVNPADDVSLARIVNVPRRGIGKKTLGRVTDHARQHGSTLLEALGEAAGADWLASGPKKRVGGFVRLLETLRSLEGSSLRDLVEAIIAETGLVASLEAAGTGEARGRAENVMELLGVVEDFEKMHPGASLEDFMEWASLRTDLDTLAEGGRAVTLMTVHNAKGLEFPVVFIVGMEDRIFPHANSMFDPHELEEERRLCYVGITRARERLYLTHAERRSLYGQRQSNPPSSFFDEMPEEHLSCLVSASTTAARSARRTAWDDGAAVPVDAEDSGRVFGAGVAKRGAASEEVEVFEAGDDVEHRMFGRGRVIAVDGDKLAIDFEDGGLKTLLVGYAPIRKAE